MAQTLKTEIKEKILSATSDLILSKGIDNISMRDIAQVTGVTAGNLYRYYKNKQEIISTIYQPMINELANIVTKHSKGKLELNTLDLSYMEHMNPSMQYQVIEHLLDSILIDIYDLAQDQKNTLKILLDDDIFSTIIHDRLCKSITQLLFHESISNPTNILIQVQMNALVQGVNTLLKYGIDLNKDEFNQLCKIHIKCIIQSLKTCTTHYKGKSL